MGGATRAGRITIDTDCRAPIASGISQRPPVPGPRPGDFPPASPPEHCHGLGPGAGAKPTGSEHAARSCFCYGDRYISPSERIDPDSADHVLPIITIAIMIGRAARVATDRHLRTRPGTCPVQGSSDLGAPRSTVLSLWLGDRPNPARPGCATTEIAAAAAREVPFGTGGWTGCHGSNGPPRDRTPASSWLPLVPTERSSPCPAGRPWPLRPGHSRPAPSTGLGTIDQGLRSPMGSVTRQNSAKTDRGKWRGPDHRSGCVLSPRLDRAIPAGLVSDRTEDRRRPPLQSHDTLPAVGVDPQADGRRCILGRTPRPCPQSAGGEAGSLAKREADPHLALHQDVFPRRLDLPICLPMPDDPPCLRVHRTASGVRGAARMGPQASLCRNRLLLT